MLYVCTGNICRSPLAEALLVQYAQRQGAAGRIRVASAGTHAWNGNHATAEARRAGELWGLDLSRHRARQVGVQIMRDADIVLAATRQHLAWLWREFPLKQNALYLALRFPQRPAGAEGADADIPDPIGETVEYYIDVLNMLAPTLPAVLRHALADQPAEEDE